MSDTKHLDEAARKHGFTDWAQASAALPDQEDPFHAIVRDAKARASTLKIELEISDKDVADLLCSAIAGGFGRAWFVLFDAQTEVPEGLTLAKPWGDEHTPQYIAAPFTEGAAVIVVMAPHDVGTKINNTDRTIQASYRLTRAELAAGLLAMASKCPQHFADFMSGEYDAITGDVFVQCCTMGEIVFG